MGIISDLFKSNLQPSRYDAFDSNQALENIIPAINSLPNTYSGIMSNNQMPSPFMVYLSKKFPTLNIVFDGIRFFVAGEIDDTSITRSYDIDPILSLLDNIDVIMVAIQRDFNIPLSDENVNKEIEPELLYKNRLDQVE